MSAADWRETSPAERMAEAERRIEEARRSGAEVLDLGDLELEELPGSLGGLPKLRQLYLGAFGPPERGRLVWHETNPRFTDLAPLAQLQALQYLDLVNTGVTDLAPLAQLQGLQKLSLVNTGVTDLAPLAQLQGLRWLNVLGCRPLLATFCALADHPHLGDLYADEVTGIPREVLSGGGNCLPRLRTYLSELKLGTEAENEVKVILLGNGRVGKTQLCRCFRGEPFDESVKSTHGVQIWRQPLRLQAGGQEQVFQVNWWDFGGQDIYHGTHALFLRSRAVFLLLWTPTLENREEYCEKGLTLRNQPLAYWLDYVRSLAGEGSPVIVVQSQCERGVRRHYHPALLQSTGFEFLESCHYSAKDDNGREALDVYLRDAVRHLLEKNGAMEIGRGRAEVRRRLYTWRSEDQEREPEERRHRTLTLEEFRALCEEAGGILSWEHALDYFHHTGVVFYRSDLFASRIILDHDWALNAIYTVFNRGQAMPWLRDSGRFTREDLAIIAWRHHSFEEQRLFLGLMESCGVCFPCGETARGETRYLAPDLLPDFEVIRNRLHAWRDGPDLPMLTLQYRFFHPTVIRGLMTMIGRQAGDLAEYWKYGLWFKDGQRATQILVQFEDTSTAGTPGAGALKLQAQGREPLRLLQEFREVILKQWSKEGPEELLTLNGFTVARSELRNAIKGWVQDTEQRLIASTAFISFFDNREPLHEKIREDLNKVLPDNGKAITLSFAAKPSPPLIFISYSHQDKRWKDSLVRHLKVLEAQSMLEIWQDRKIGAGAAWESEILEAMERAAVAVLLVSADFLSSPFILEKEIPYLRKRRVAGTLSLIPLIVRPCAWEKVGWLSELLCRPEDGRPLSTVPRPKAEEALTMLVMEIQRSLEAVSAFVKLPNLVIQPQRLGPGEKPAEVFISYAWGDDTPEGKTRTKAVDGIYRALAEHGFQPVRDRDQIRPGERISPFMARLTSADLVVVVISDKYLRSYYCMYEFYRLWQRFQGDRDELARHVVPIVLPEVQMGSVKARAPYLEYWIEQKEELDALRRKLDLSLSAEDWDEIRLVHEFSHHVAQILGFLNDVLMPQKLEAHLDDGFEAVREALGRRLSER